MLLAIDQGTTGTTCLVFDLEANLLGRGYREFTQHFPEPGHVEHDAQEIWTTTEQTIEDALQDAGATPQELEAIGITNQRETVVVWDPDTGEPLHRALVWQDRRTARRCDELREQGHLDLIRDKTGLVLDPYFSGTKIEWLLQNVDGLREKAQKGRAKFGTIDSWITYKLTGEHVTDPSNASRTLLYDIHRNTWDEELADLLDVPLDALPEVRPSAGTFGTTTNGTPVAGILGDQQAALFGQRCLDPGLAKNTYGTGSFVLLNTGTTPPAAREGLLTTVAWQIGDTTTYASEAAIFVTGAAVQWLRDGLNIIEQAADTEALAKSLDSNDGVYLVPAFTGLGSPHWDPYARGTIVGLTRGTGKAHLARAALEAMAYQAVDAIAAMEKPLEELRADGGATVNRWLMQFQADILGVPVVVPEIPETTALGAALIAGVGAQLLTLDQVAKQHEPKARFEPTFGDDQRAELLDGWHRALEHARGWAA